MAVIAGTILDNAGAIYNVKNTDFAGGAKGDGVTDDFAAINAAIVAATATGGAVYFPPGTYIVAQALQGRSSKRNVLVGANCDSCTIKSQSGGAVLDWQTVGFDHRRESTPAGSKSSRLTATMAPLSWWTSVD